MLQVEQLKYEWTDLIHPHISPALSYKSLNNNKNYCQHIVANDSRAADVKVFKTIKKQLNISKNFQSTFCCLRERILFREQVIISMECLLCS